MADTRISDLAALTGANLASTDEFVVVDKSDTTMNSSGTDKRQTATELATGLSTKSPLYAPTGLTGATAVSRYVGGTTSGAPASGTFAVGDFVVDQSGIMWICTAAGSPGTWIDTSSGRELGYAEITSTFTTTALAAANQVDVTGLIVTVTVGSRPILVEFCGNAQNDTINDAAALTIVEAAAGDTNRTPALTCTTITMPIANKSTPVRLAVRLAPSAGSHTYKLQLCAITGGTAKVSASASNTFGVGPAFLRVVNG